jgi:hypothetical protein
MMQSGPGGNLRAPIASGGAWALTRQLTAATLSQ